MLSYVRTKIGPKDGRKRKRGQSSVPRQQLQFLRFPAKMLYYDPERRVTRKKKKIEDHNVTSKLLNLPTEIFLLIVNELGVLDCAALALTCKDIAAKVEAHGHLLWDGPAKHQPQPTFPSGQAELLFFFQHQLGKGWVPRDLKYCHVCGKYSPREDGAYWVERLRTKFTGKHGALSRYVENEFLHIDKYDRNELICCTRSEQVYYAWLDWEECCPECKVHFKYHTFVYGR